MLFYKVGFSISMNCETMWNSITIFFLLLYYFYSKDQEEVIFKVEGCDEWLNIFADRPHFFFKLSCPFVSGYARPVPEIVDILEKYNLGRGSI